MNFFEEFEQLRLSVPRVALSNIRGENSKYVNMSLNNKSCYMLFGSDHNEDSIYGDWMNFCKDSVDCSYVANCELCLECTDCLQCYNCYQCQDCESCVDSSYLYDCLGCQDCFACVGLRKKRYYILNKPYPPEHYNAIVKDALKRGHDFIWQELERLKEKMPRRAVHELHNHACTGNYIYHSKSTVQSFDANDCEDCAYMNNAVVGTKDCFDCSYVKNLELSYECHSVTGFNLNFCDTCWDCSNLEYCELCFNCHNCFGCVGLKNKKYHILNKEYSPEEYEKEVKRIVTELKEQGLYAKRFHKSVYPFEDTLAALYF